MGKKERGRKQEQEGRKDGCWKQNHRGRQLSKSRCWLHKPGDQNSAPRAPSGKRKPRPESCPLTFIGVVVHRHSPVMMMMMMITNENTATKLLKIVTMDPESINHNLPTQRKRTIWLHQNLKCMYVYIHMHTYFEFENVKTRKQMELLHPKQTIFISDSP